MKNQYEVRGKETAIFIRRRNGAVIEAIIDTDDLQIVSSMPHSWTVTWSPITDSYYVRASSPNEKRKNVSLHRWIMNPSVGTQVDHINHDTLNNKRSNLRVVSRSTNLLNRKSAQRNNKSSGIRGVYFNQRYQKWHARLQFKGKRKHLGYYDRLPDACEAVKIELSKFV